MSEDGLHWEPGPKNSLEGALIYDLLEVSSRLDSVRPMNTRYAFMEARPIGARVSGVPIPPLLQGFEMLSITPEKSLF